MKGKKGKKRKVKKRVCEEKKHILDNGSWRKQNSKSRDDAVHLEEEKNKTANLH